MEKGQKLPAPDFCNKKAGGKANPIFGRGALGNQSSGRMYYTGGDTEELVTLVQTMLTDLGYTVGPAGADGKFGNDTEKAVKKFQEEHEDWGGENLNVDGLVGPETSDALNRALVGVEGWYDRHQTEKELTGDFSLLTVQSGALRQPVPFDVGDTKKGRVVITGTMHKKTPGVTLTIRVVDPEWKPLSKTRYRLEIDDDGWTPVESDTDENGVLEQEVPRQALTGRLMIAEYTFDLFIIPHPGPAAEHAGAIVRLANMAYPVTIPESFLTSQEMEEGPGLRDAFTIALMQFQQDHDQETSGTLDEPTVKKLEETYGE